MVLPDKVYDFLKWFCLIFLPAFAVFYEMVGSVAGLPYVELVKTVCLALGTLIGSCIGVSHLNYYTGADNE